ncbi:MAG: DUF2666 family protein [Candidatus Micrarchaeota archaeon]|nr:DUF2666 family protein [Candidatus Micrarchaeota archaeon]
MCQFGTETSTEFTQLCHSVLAEWANHNHFLTGETMDKEEIILVGKYKNLNLDRHYYVDKCGDTEVAALLVDLSNVIEPYIYQFSGIDTKKIDDLINVGLGLPAVISFFKSFKRNDLLSAAQNKNTMMSIAESYLVNRVLTKANVAFKPMGTHSIKQDVEIPESLIAFIGNCKGWFAAKKLTINEKTEAWEVAGILSGINHTMVNKSFGFAKLSGNTKIGRKSLSSLAEALATVDVNNPYEICKTCEGFGIKPYAAPEMLMKEYPDIKPPKVKGRKSK